MYLDYFYNSLVLIKPELAITLFLVIVVIADLIAKKNRLLPYLAISGLVIALYFVIEQYGSSGLGFTTENQKGQITLDPFSNFFKLIIGITTIIVILFSLVSKEIEECSERSGEYYALIMGMILGMFFMVSSSDLIIMYLSIELVSLSSYVLAGFMKKSTRSAEAALKYVIYGSVASGITLFGISLVYGLTGTTNFYELNSLIASVNGNPVIIYISLLMLFTGIGYKISAVPFHFWTPDVYEGAPTVITAYLSVASKAAGFAILLRFIKVSFVIGKDNFGFWILLTSFDWKNFIVLLSILTMTLGNLVALWQNNLKRMLAYSSIAHAGYLLAAVAVLSDRGLIAVLLYFLVYLLMNLGAFFCVILIQNKINSEEIDDYDGIGYTMPFMGVLFAIFLVSLVGLPPTAGFIGKLYVFIALVDAKMYVLAIIALLNSVVSLYYYVRVLKHMYLSKPKQQAETVHFSFGQNLLLLVLAVPVIVFGLYFTPLVELVKSSLTIFGF